MKWSKALVGAASLAVVAGVIPSCGGDSDDPPNKVDTGLPPEQTLGTLTDADARQACERLVRVFSARYTEDTIVQGVCTRFALSLADDAGSCNDLRNECKDQASQEAEIEPLEETDCTDADASQFADCELTVTDLEACSNDMIAAFDGYLNQYSCSDAGKIEAEDISLDFDVEYPASCARIETECPNTALPTDMLMPP